MRLIGLTRVRNESLVIADTLAHLDAFCDGIVVYDDCSTDDTPELVRRSQTNVLSLIRGETWSKDRIREETRHRRILAERGATYGADWLLYLDADERIECDLRTLLESTPTRISGIKLGLLDAYLSDGQVQPYTGGALADLSRLFGPDERRILMLWRPERAFCFLGSDQREPVPGLGCRIVEGPTVVKHFGKAISISQWEETCAYYTEHFPEPYRSKWAERRGRAIHSESDFGRPLLPWKDAIADTIRIDPPRRNGRLLLRRLQASVIHGVRRRTPRREKVEQRGEIAHL